MWRRVRLIPFTVTIPDERQDKGLLDALKSELPGILAWCVRGMLEWQKNGLGCPDCVKIATEEYRASQDLIGEFIDDCCLVGNDFRVRCGEFYAALKTWCEASGERCLNPKSVGLALHEKGYETKRGHDKMYHGLALRQKTSTDF